VHVLLARGRAVLEQHFPGFSIEGRVVGSGGPGRRLTDDVVDIELQALEGAVRTGKLVPALAKGDGVDTNDVPFGRTFPYVALPHNEAVNRGVGDASSSGSPTGGAATGGGGTAMAHTSRSLPVLPTSVALLGLVITAGGAVALRRNPR
jgi:hypothetical protein